MLFVRNPRFARVALAALISIGVSQTAAAQNATPAAAPPAEAERPTPPPPPANQRPALVIDAESGAVLHAVNPHLSWHPASLTKMMTVYVALAAVRDGRMSLQSMLTVSPLAARQSPSKMGFRPGTQVSLEAAIFMLMVKSANDVSVTVAEGIGGNYENFIAEMNTMSRRLGMTGSVWRNPNGLHDPDQVTTARDMALLARALYRDFPEHQRFYRAQAIQFGRATMRNFNQLIGRYPGADGMKTGFICASGFNLVASASRNGRRHIAVVLGERSGRSRSEHAAGLLERSWGSGGGVLEGGWFGGERPRIEAMLRSGGPTVAPNLRQEICVERRGRTPSESEDLDAPETTAPVLSLGADQNPALATLLPGQPAANGVAAVAGAAGQRPSLLAPMPPSVSAIIIGRSITNPRDRRPMRVAVVGSAAVGRGLPIPATAMNPQNLGTGATAVAARPAVATDQAPARATAGPTVLTPTPPPARRTATSPAPTRRNATPPSQRQRAQQQQRRPQAAQQQRRQPTQQQRPRTPTTQQN